MTGRNVAALAGAALVSGLGIAYACGGVVASDARPTRGTTIVAFGDSLVSGNGTSGGGNFVSVLSSRLGVNIINAGRSGDTTSAALNRLQSDVLARDPRIVIVLLGGNDLLRGVPQTQRLANMTQIVQRIRAAGSAVLLVGLSDSFLNPFGGGLDELADRTDSALVPGILDGILGRQELMADGIHPNNAGHRLIADRIEPALKDLLR
jgi:lysophospholipase L1-like esterase